MVYERREKDYKKNLVRKENLTEWEKNKVENYFGGPSYNKKAKNVLKPSK